MKEHVLPLLAGRLPGGVIVHKNIMTYGVAEAMLAERLVIFEKELPAEIKLAYLPAYGVIKLRLTAAGSDEKKIRKTVREQVEKLYGIIPDVIYGEDEVMLEEVVGKLLNDNNLTLSTAESCTGGKIASLITSVPGSSGWFTGSVVAYDNSIKTGVLGVSNETLRLYGAVSAETAGEMARGVRRLMGTDYSVAVTGIAGPTGGTADKPVGTVWIAVDSERGLLTEKQIFGDNRLDQHLTLIIRCSQPAQKTDCQSLNVRYFPLLEKNEEIIWLIELKSRILRTDFRNFSEQVKKNNNVKSLSGHRKEGSDRKQCFPLEEKDQKKVYGQPVYQKVLSA